MSVMHRGLAGAVFAILLILWPGNVFAQTAKDQETCTKNGMTVGFFHDFKEKNCQRSFIDESGSKRCSRGAEACCLDRSNNLQCVPYGAGFTPAVRDEISTEGIQQKAVTQLQKQGRLAEQKKFEFTPNIPIPGSEFSGGGVKIDSTLFARYLGAFFTYFIGVVGILAIVVMMWGGYHYIVAAGNPQKMKEGKEIITNAVVGLVLALTSIVLLRTINPALVNIGSIVPGFITEQLQPFDALVEPDKSYAFAGVDTSQFSNELPKISQNIKNRGYHTIAKREADRQGVDVYRVLAIMAVETRGGLALKTSSKGACGLMQVLDANSRYDCNQLNSDPDIGISEGVFFLKNFERQPCLTVCTTDKSGKKICKPACTQCTRNDWQYINAAYNGGYKANTCSEVCRGATLAQCGASGAKGKKGWGETKQYVAHAELAYSWFKNNFKF